MNTSKITKVLVCGSRYGQSYLPVIFQDPELELVGIYSTGSERSVRLTEQYGVDNYTALSDIDDTIDLACIALPHDTAIHIAETLLSNKIRVLIEHPIQANAVNRLIDVSIAANTQFHINSHFPELPPARDFIQKCNTLNLNSPPLSISIQCNSRTLYSCLDILMRCFGMFSFDVRTIEQNHSYYHCSFSINDSPCSLVYQAWKYEEDNSQDSPLGHNITVTYPKGSLQLCSSFGPCLWLPTIAYNMPSPTHIKHSQPEIPEAHQTILWRKQANRESMHKLLSNKATPAHQSAEYLRHLCKTWESVSNNFVIKILDHSTHNK